MKHKCVRCNRKYECGIEDCDLPEVYGTCSDICRVYVYGGDHLKEINLPGLDDIEH